MAVERQRLDDERQSITHHFVITSFEGDRDYYVTCGLYPDGRLGEIFIRAGKEGSFSSAVLDALATIISIGLQYGLALETFCAKLRHIRCEPSGLVQGAPEGLAGGAGRKFIAQSPLDYLAAWLIWRFPDGVLLGWVDR